MKIKRNTPQYRVGQRITVMGYESLGSCERIKGTIVSITKERRNLFYNVLLETGYINSLEERLIIPIWQPFNSRVRNWKAQNQSPVNK